MRTVAQVAEADSRRSIETSPLVVQLEDGTVLEFLISLPTMSEDGQYQAYSTESLLKRTAEKIQPFTRHRQLGILPSPVGMRGAIPGAISFFFVLRNLPGPPEPAFDHVDSMPMTGKGWYGRRNGTDMWIEAVDDSGFTYRSYHPPRMVTAVQQRLDEEIVEFFSLSLNNYPRRQQRFTLRLHARDVDEERGRLVGEFQVDNPSPSEFPVWTASPLPSTNTIGNMQAVLKGFEFVLPRSYYTHREGRALLFPHQKVMNPPFRYQTYRCEPQLATFSNPQERETHRLHSYRYEDPAGNAGRAYELSPGEPVWKLEMQLYPSRGGEFADRSMRQFRDLPVPGPGEVIPDSKTLSIDGIEFRLFFISGPGWIEVHHRSADTNQPVFNATPPDVEPPPYADPGSGFTLPALEAHVEPTPWNAGNRLKKLKWSGSSEFSLVQSLDARSRESVLKYEHWKTDHHLVVIDILRGVDGNSSGNNAELLFRFTDHDGNPIDHPQDPDGHSHWNDIGEDDYFTRHPRRSGVTAYPARSSRKEYKHYIFPLELEETVRRINVECIVNRRIDLECMVRSEDVLSIAHESIEREMEQWASERE